MIYWFVLVVLIIIMVVTFAVYSHVHKSDSSERFPQKLTIGQYHQTAHPWISSDIWSELVDNKSSYFLRSNEDNYPSVQKLKKWMDNCSSDQIVIIINNQIDVSLPGEIGDDQILEHSKLKCLYVTNPDRVHHKIKGIPIGLKWQFASTHLYGEDKTRLRKIYSQVSKNSDQVAHLLYHVPRINKIWIRPMANSNSTTTQYKKINQALKTPRADIMKRLQCKNIEYDESLLSPQEYFQKLKSFRFVISPAGNGLDSHSHWEALLAGCIPIIAHSYLDSLYSDLPVWFVSDWQEITDDSIDEKSQYFLNTRWNLDKIFADWWKNQISSAIVKKNY